MFFSDVYLCCVCDNLTIHFWFSVQNSSLFAAWLRRSADNRPQLDLISFSMGKGNKTKPLKGQGNGNGNGGSNKIHHQQDHRKMSQSPGSESTCSVETTVQVPASASSRSSASVTTVKSSKASSAAGDSELIMAKLEARLKEVDLAKSSDDNKNVKNDDSDKKAKLKDEGTDNLLVSQGLLLVKDLGKKDEPNQADKPGFREGRKVKCSKCHENEDSWRNMKSEKVWIDNGGEESDMYWKYTCIECHMKDTGMTREQAIADLKSQRPDNVKRKARIIEFTNARKKVQENFPMMSSKQEVRVLTRQSFSEMFAPFVKIIELKIRHMEMNSGLWEEYEKLVSLMKVCTSAEESKALLARMQAHEQKMEEMELPMAFQEKCVPGSETHWRYMQAAQYSDEWVCNKDPKGHVTSAFRSFYICLAGGTDQCLTVIPSKKWSTKHDDPLAAKQRWYCICCGAMYKTRFGMVVEIQIRGNFYYVRAPIPPDNLEDTRALYLEQTLKPSSPEDLLDKLKDVVPHPSEILRRITQNDVWGNQKTRFDPDAFKLSANAYKKFQEFDWQQIMNFGGK